MNPFLLLISKQFLLLWSSETKLAFAGFFSHRDSNTFPGSDLSNWPSASLVSSMSSCSSYICLEGDSSTVTLVQLAVGAAKPEVCRWFTKLDAFLLVSSSLFLLFRGTVLGNGDKLEQKDTLMRYESKGTAIELNLDNLRGIEILRSFEDWYLSGKREIHAF